MYHLVFHSKKMTSSLATLEGDLTELTKLFPQAVLNISLTCPLIPVSFKFLLFWLSAVRDVGRQAAYCVAFVKYFQVRVLVTMFDNYNFFAGLNRLAPSCRVVAIQNGHRTFAQLKALAADIRGYEEHRSRLLHDIYLCWGQNDVERLMRFGIKSKEIIPIGSLRDSLYRDHYREEARHVEYPISVVLIKRKTFSETSDEYRKNQSSSRKQLLKMISIYCSEQNIEPAFILTPGTESSLEFQRDLINQNYDGPWTEAALNKLFSTYCAADASHIIIGDNSSVLVEALGRYQRILSCNLTDDPSLDFSLPGPWFLKNPTYEQFAERLTMLREMTEDEWGRQLGSIPRYLINFDPRDPTHEVVKKIVKRLIDEY